MTPDPQVRVDAFQCTPNLLTWLLLLAVLALLESLGYGWAAHRALTLRAHAAGAPPFAPLTDTATPPSP